MLITTSVFTKESAQYTRNIESKIDQLVYKLYVLTYEENRHRRRPKIKVKQIKDI